MAARQIAGMHNSGSVNAGISLKGANKVKMAEAAFINKKRNRDKRCLLVCSC
jgi:hypothetical protein